MKRKNNSRYLLKCVSRASSNRQGKTPAAFSKPTLLARLLPDDLTHFCATPSARYAVFKIDKPLTQPPFRNVGEQISVIDRRTRNIGPRFEPTHFDFSAENIPALPIKWYPSSATASTCLCESARQSKNWQSQSFGKLLHRGCRSATVGVIHNKNDRDESYYFAGRHVALSRP